MTRFIFRYFGYRHGLSSDRADDNANKQVGQEVIMIEAPIEKVRRLRPRRIKKKAKKSKKAFVQDKTVLQIETLMDEPGEVLLELGTEKKR